MVARKSKVPLLPAFDFIFVCRCPFCQKKGIREAKTMEYSRETFCEAKEGVQLKQQHVVLNKYGFVLYNHLLPQGNATSQRKAHSLACTPLQKEWSRL